MKPTAEWTRLEREWSPSSRVDDIGVHLDRYASRSARARTELAVRRSVRCGPLPEQTFDYFPAPRAGAPLAVYVHGGYWQELSKEEAAFAALDFVEAGAAFAALGYGLAPRYSMRRLTAAAAHSLRLLCTSLAALPGAPGTVHLIGHSAGAHLVISALLDTAAWQRTGHHPATAVASATLLSGVYDLEPLRHTYINDALGMDAAEARECSPLGRLPARLPPLVVARGSEETTAFADQQERLVRAARRGGTQVSELVAAGRHHFDLPFDLADPSTELGASVLRHMAAPPWPPPGGPGPPPARRRPVHLAAPRPRRGPGET